jgi:hypothetical protein
MGLCQAVLGDGSRGGQEEVTFIAHPQHSALGRYFFVCTFTLVKKIREFT